jgi:DNA-binding response OmpR family regulator
MGPIRILVCDEDQDTVRHLMESFRSMGHEVLAVDRLRKARALLEDWRPDLVILDVLLGAADGAGWTLLDHARSAPGGPAVLVVTKLHRVDDRIRALRSGADDCVQKPFHPEELLARMEAVLRRTRPAADGGLIIDDERKEVRFADRVVSLSPKEYELLCLLNSARGRVFSSDEILKALWRRPASYATRQDVQKYVYLLRKKLEPDPKRPGLVLTVRGFGYRLAA